jgi:hypothetical protein
VLVEHAVQRLHHLFHRRVLEVVFRTWCVDEGEVDAMRAGCEPADPVHAAVYAIARDVVLQRGRVDDDILRRAEDAGLTDTDLLRLVAECTFAGFVGTVDNLAGRVPLDEYLRPRQWKSG